MYFISKGIKGLMNNIQKRGFHNLNKISFPFLAFGKIEKEAF